MSEPELLCSFSMIKADYRPASGINRPPDRCFHITITVEAQDVQFDVPQGHGELFANELEALAAIVRERVVRARLVANA